MADLSSDLIISHFPMMERPKQRSNLLIPKGEGWSEQAGILLRTTRVAPEGSLDRRYRKVGRGQNKRSMPAKHCAPGVTAYAIPEGSTRGRQTAETQPWHWLPIDLDAVPLTVDETLCIVKEGLGVRSLAWTTWSCKDGYASVRVMIPLPEPVEFKEVINLWWAARQRLIAAGMPEESAKGDEPANDSRALDGRLFFLPAAPDTLEVGEEGWGGVIPRGYVSDESVPFLDLSEWIAEGETVRLTGEALHRERWPSVPIPGFHAFSGAGRASGGTGFMSMSFADTSAGAVREDFGEVPMYGEPESNLRAWADKNLPTPGTEILIGSVFDSTIWGPGDRATAYTSLMLHRGDDGHLWAHDYRSGENFVDTFRPGRAAEDEFITGEAFEDDGFEDENFDPNLDVPDEADLVEPPPEPEPEPEPPPEPEPEPEPAPVPAPSVSVDPPTGTYEELQRSCQNLLTDVGTEREVEVQALLGWWEAFDKVGYLVREGKIDETRGAAALHKLKTRVLHKLMEGSHAV